LSKRHLFQSFFAAFCFIVILLPLGGIWSDAIDSTLIQKPEAQAIQQDTIDLAGEWKVTPIDDSEGSSWEVFRLPGRIKPQEGLDFRKVFTIPAGLAREGSWHFEVNDLLSESLVLLNGKEIKPEVLEYGDLRITLPKVLLREGKNTLDLLQPYVRKTNGSFPFRATGRSAEEYLGVAGNLRLVHTASVFLHEPEISINSSGKLQGKIQIENRGDQDETVALRSSLSGSDITGSGIETTVTVKPRQSVSVNLSQVLNTSSYWQPAMPALHNLKCELVREGQLIEQRGWNVASRVVGVDKNNILINGAPVPVHGARYESASQGSSQILKDLLNMKGIGINVLRIVGVPSSTLLHFTDSLGIMVFVELPFTQSTGEFAASQGVQNQMKAMLSSLADHVRMHPSVIAIGLGGGNDDWNGITQQLYNELASYVKGLMANNILCYAITEDYTNGFALDFAALSLSLEANTSEMGAALNHFSSAHRGKRPCLLFDVGGFVSSHYKGINNFLSEEAQAQTIANTILTADHLGFGGVVLSAYKDYSTELPYLTADNADRHVATLGLVTITDKPRLSAEAVKAAFLGVAAPQLSSGETVAEDSWGFLVYGFLLLILFFLLINVDRRFREYIMRALWRSFNFFADVRDQRLIPNVQTTILAIVLSGSLAITLGGLLYDFRMSVIAERYIRLVFPSKMLSNWLYGLAWSPFSVMVEFSLVVLVAIFLITAIVRFAAIFVKGRIFLGDAFNITVWALLPMIFLLPFGMLVTRIDRTESLVFVTFWVLIVLGLWLFYRLLKGIAVLFDIYPTKVYLYCTLGLGVTVGLFLFYIDSKSGLFSYYDILRHLSKIWHG